MNIIKDNCRVEVNNCDLKDVPEINKPLTSGSSFDEYHELSEHYNLVKQYLLQERYNVSRLEKKLQSYRAKLINADNTVRSLEQELTVLKSKNNSLQEYASSVKNLEQELTVLKSENNSLQEYDSSVKNLEQELKSVLYNLTNELNRYKFYNKVLIIFVIISFCLCIVFYYF